MANTIEKLLPGDADFSAGGNIPGHEKVGTDPKREVLAYDAATVETAYWTRVAKVGLTGTLKAIIHFFIGATTGKVDFEVSIEAITSGTDSISMTGAASFHTVNAANKTVLGTANYPDKLEVTLDYDDSITAGDQYRIKVERDADDGTDDTAAGDCYVTIVEIQDDV